MNSIDSVNMICYPPKCSKNVVSELCDYEHYSFECDQLLWMKHFQDVAVKTNLVCTFVHWVPMLVRPDYDQKL